MKKKILSLLLTVLLVSALMTSTASAGGNVGLRNVQFSLGSLDLAGTLTGLGGYTDGVIVELVASGTPVVTCTTRGGNDSPGQNPSQVLARGVQLITKILKNGTAPVEVSAEPTLTATEGGCPNNNWTANIDFVFWTNATITVTDPSTDPDTVLLQQNYTCVTTRDPDSVSCTPVP
jgi:hypothetical protein